MKPEQARDLNDQAVRHLVKAHVHLEEPLLLAIRFKVDEPGIHLLEVLDGFPGEDDDAPMETEFGPSPDVRMVGPLTLALGNPAQFRTLIGSNSPLFRAVKDGGRVEYAVDAGRELADLLGLANSPSQRELEARKKLIVDSGVTLSETDRENLKKAWG